MNILQRCEYKFPAKGSAGAERVVERLCRGLTKLGHKVYLWGNEGSIIDTGATVVDSIPDDVDVIHHHGFTLEKEAEYKSWNRPWISTIHGGGMESDTYWLNKVKNHSNILCVSKFVSNRLGCPAYVHTCVSPEEFEYKEKSDDYFLYLAGFGWGTTKGIDVFIELARKIKNKKFYIAGAGGQPQFVEQVKKICQENKNMKFIGEINGKIKSDFLSNAKALIYPTHLPDACPSSVVEALMCGTPVIGSNNGSMPELITKQCGFICNSQSDYMKAILNIEKINRIDCRNYAMENYSDVVAAKKHLLYYENIIKNGRIA